MTTEKLEHLIHDYDKLLKTTQQAIVKELLKQEYMEEYKKERKIKIMYTKMKTDKQLAK